MKKKILLVGKISEILGSIHETLDAEFDVQLCAPQLNTMEGMVKVLRPALMVVCTIGVYDLDYEFTSWIDHNYRNMPVVFIAKKDDIDEIKKKCFTDRYTYLSTPINLETIFKTCNKIIDRVGNIVEVDRLVDKVNQIVEEQKKKQILTIDDSPIVLRYVKNILKDEYEIILATSGEMGIKKAKEVKPDLILLDYEMPAMDGHEVFLNLRVDEETEKIPVMFLTSVSDTKKVKEVLDLHPAGYILKPLDADQLLTKVHKVLGDDWQIIV